ncbi:hypothetical protein PHYC_03244 [Phycisphaerales bacterium]|nr:hypothetical protein PHYC_03244 [Phycisphaerales bacterium]
MPRPDFTNPPPALSDREQVLLRHLAGINFDLSALMRDPNFTAQDLASISANPAFHHHLALLTSLSLQAMTLRAVQARIVAIDQLELATRQIAEPIEKARAAKTLLRATAAPIIPTRRDAETGLLHPAGGAGSDPSRRRDEPDRDPPQPPPARRAAANTQPHPIATAPTQSAPSDPSDPSDLCNPDADLDDDDADDLAEDADLDREIDREAAAFEAKLGVPLDHPDILTALRDGRAADIEQVAARIRAAQPQPP